MECFEMFVSYFPLSGPGSWVNVLWGTGNTPSIKFYESIGAENMGKEWQVMRLVDDKLVALAKGGPEVERR